MDEHGPEALEPHRTEPIPHGVICSIMGLIRQTATHHDGNGKEVLQIVADDLKHYSLRALWQHTCRQVSGKLRRPPRQKK